MMRLTPHALLDLDDRLTERDRQVIKTVGRFRLASARQLERLHWTEGTPMSRARLARHSLARLVELGVLARLSRRVGGVRAGSAGHIYALNRAGQRLYRPEAARARPPVTPSSMFTRHILGVTELCVQLAEAHRQGQLELLAFDPEPDCWRRYIGRAGTVMWLKPDAFLRLGIGAYTDRYFVELDCGTKGSSATRRQLQNYIDYYRTGHEQHEHGVFPRVLLIATTDARAAQLIDIASGLPAEAWRLFTVTTFSRVIEHVCAEVPS